ncbi:iron-containing alcohol dehydrogenase [Alkalidesulfovibrio alkalitolerans DSM 16529]|uniref:Iron-containing alcohol dehydrogenase n=1 Tax=Alkalidesulfovibrio alkalitolerans DSM 16529 TaxID=1121439 RepID=S7UL32_9BACT|nr:alcohol dehydrogenase-like regulatory protein ErcA [Alkalidesulfovibrio alkalitolerans]EPR33038.1 iron-containing alcohol dehydrogenase [Alkalidesulfovibrio alkalitolerans DSM 16529]
MPEPRLTELRKFIAPEFVFGPGASALTARYARNFHASRVLLVSDPGVMEAGWTEQVAESLRAAGVTPVLFADVSPNPRDHEVMRGADIYAAEGCEAIVAVGGGSPMDCAKAIGVAQANGAHVLSFEGVDNVPEPGPPLICLPTTSGSAAEVSQFSIITDTGRSVKIAIVSKTMIPDVALIDPVLTTTMDAHLTACTGLDALTHAVEAYVSNAHFAITDQFALSAIRRIAGNLLSAIRSPGDIEARSQMLLASLEAGLAFSNAILGAVHAMAHSLGGLLDLPHGEVNALLLPYVADYNFDACPKRYRDVATALGVDEAGLSDTQTRRALFDGLVRLKNAAGITSTLGQLGVDENDLAGLARNAARDPCLLTNPKSAGEDDLRRLYAQAL